MIQAERILSITGSRIITTGGIRRAAGNELHRVGDDVTVCGDLVLGWRRPPGQIPGPWPDEPGYRFADACGPTMYYVSEDFSEITDQANIDVPDPNASLILHCYSADAEYLVWVIQAPVGEIYSYVVQKISDGDAETIGTFYEYWAEKNDGYVDENGDFHFALGCSVYVGADEFETIFVMRYINAHKTETLDYSAPAFNAALGESGRSILLSALDSPSVSWSNEVTTTTARNLATGTSYIFGHKWSAQFAGFRPDTAQNGYYYMGGLHSPFYDLWESKTIITIAGDSYMYLNAFIDQTGWDWQNNVNDQSYNYPAVTPYINVLRSIIASTGEIVANIVEVDNGTLSKKVDNIILSGTEDNAATLDGNGNAATLLITGNPINWTGTFATPSVDGFWLWMSNWNSDLNLWSTVEGFTMQCTKGANKPADTDPGNGDPVIVTPGEIRKADIIGWSTPNSVAQIKMVEPWTNTPLTTDRYNITFVLGVDTEIRTQASANISLSLSGSATDNLPDHGIITDLGNDYAVVTVPIIGSVYGWMKYKCLLTHKGAKIYEGEEYVDLAAAAWRTEENSLTGLINDGATLVTVDGDDVTLTDINLLSNIVTKRFV